MRVSVRPFKSASTSLGSLQADVASNLITASADIALVLDADGVIQDLAFGESDFHLSGTEDWLGILWADTVNQDSRFKIDAMLDDVTHGRPTRWRQVNHPQGNDSVPVQYVAMRLAADGRIVAIGRDMRAIALLQQQLIRAQQAMERDYERFRDAEARYRLLFRVSAEAVLILEARNRTIVEANQAAANLLGRPIKALAGAVFPDDLAAYDFPGGGDLLEAAAARSASVQARITPHGAERPLNVMAHMFSQDDGDFLLVRLTDEQEGHTIRQARNGVSRISDILQHMPDGFVITDQQGEVTAVNQAFLSMAQMTRETQVIGQPLDRWLIQPGLGLSGLLANLRQQKSVRLFSTKLTGALEDEREVEISAVAIDDAQDCHFGFVIRDIERRLAQAPTHQNDLKGAVQHMAELVGQVSLKDIVRETTDVIERLCIEAALTMTKDNRASAAEMLGLSRQSLYVKMRRFGVGDHSEDSRQ